MMREVASLADIPSDTDKKSIDPKMKSDGGGSDGSSINMMNGRDEPGNPSNGTMCSPGGSDAVGLSKQQIAAAVAAARPPGGWYKGTGMSDITWQEPTAEGVLPLSDYRNKRFKLIPSIVEGPWVVKMAVGYVSLIGKEHVLVFYPPIFLRMMTRLLCVPSEDRPKCTREILTIPYPFIVFTGQHQCVWGRSSSSDILVEKTIWRSTRM
jgi:hypothetical protein